MQAPLVQADTFAHVADSTVKGLVAALPGGGNVSAVVLIALILAINAVLIFAAFRAFKAAGGVKVYLADFPSHNASTALALILIFETGLVVLIRLALGLVFPDNYETWTWALVGLAGVNVAGLGVKRFSDDRYVAAKALGKTAGKPNVNVEGDANINTTSERAVVIPVKPGPSFGGSSQ